MISGETKPLPRPRARPGHPQHASCSQAGCQLAPQRSAPLNEQGLINGLVTDAHRLIVREVDRQTPSNLLWAPGPRPSPILPRALATAIPRHGGNRNRSAIWGHGDAGKLLLHISAQGHVECKLRRLGAPRRSIRMPLRGRSPILQPAAAGGRVAPQLTGDGRGGTPEATSNLLHGMTLDSEKRDLFALQQCQIPPGKRSCRRFEYCWWHTACLSEPSGSHRLRYSSRKRSIFATQTQGDSSPEPNLFVTSSCGRPSRRR